MCQKDAPAVSHLARVVEEQRVVGEADARDFKFLVGISVGFDHGSGVEDCAAVETKVPRECGRALQTGTGDIATCKCWKHRGQGLKEDAVPTPMEFAVRWKPVVTGKRVLCVFFHLFVFRQRKGKYMGDSYHPFECFHPCYM